ncbi:16S rRNA (guanine(527)-N(7))-methyltransferase RsmG [Flavobacteriaceae bacterium]|nr:16S rRNA (guanine(527)-N(7))-methyltransferase RsmG [Flavobacteriaceae bacterium]
MNLFGQYFSGLSYQQINQFSKLDFLYKKWNSKINIVSRKDIGFLNEKHILHSLAIAKFHSFKSGTEVLDVGTGGGFPGIPLAILLPEVKFYLIDSIGKKIKVVDHIRKSLDLKNIRSCHTRVEDFNIKADFIVSRAVTKMNDFIPLVYKNIKPKNQDKIKNGIICLKGGDLDQELIQFPRAQQIELSSYFDSEFFNTKKIVYLSRDEIYPRKG